MYCYTFIQNQTKYIDDQKIKIPAHFNDPDNIYG